MWSNHFRQTIRQLDQDYYNTNALARADSSFIAAPRRRMRANLVDLHIKTEYNRTNLGWMNAGSVVTPGLHHSIIYRDRHHVRPRWTGRPPTGRRTRRRHLKCGAR